MEKVIICSKGVKESVCYWLRDRLVGMFSVLILTLDVGLATKPSPAPSANPETWECVGIKDGFFVCI